MSALQVAGYLIATQTGLAYAQTIDPTQKHPRRGAGQFHDPAGRHADLSHQPASHGDRRDRRQLPHAARPGGHLPTGDMAQLVIQLHLFLLCGWASSWSAPFLVFGFALYAGLGVLARLMPQLQIFFVAVPLNIMCGFLIMLALIGSLMTVFLTYYTNSWRPFCKPWQEDQDKSQQTEEPTAKTAGTGTRAWRCGQIRRLTTFILLGGGTLAIAMFGKYAALGLARTLSLFLQQPDAMRRGRRQPSGDDAPAAAQACHGGRASLCGDDRGGACRPYAAEPAPAFLSTRSCADFSKVSPLAGFQAAVRRGRAGSICSRAGQDGGGSGGGRSGPSFGPERHGLEAILSQTTIAVASDSRGFLFKVMIGVIGVIGLDRGPGLFWQRMRWLSRNRMSKQEIKEEYRQNEGRPHHQGPKSASCAMNAPRKRMMAAVPTASVVDHEPDPLCGVRSNMRAARWRRRSVSPKASTRWRCASAPWRKTMTCRWWKIRPWRARCMPLSRSTIQSRRSISRQWRR